MINKVKEKNAETLAILRGLSILLSKLLFDKESEIFKV